MQLLSSYLRLPYWWLQLPDCQMRLPVPLERLPDWWERLLARFLHLLLGYLQQTGSSTVRSRLCGWMQRNEDPVLARYQLLSEMDGIPNGTRTRVTALKGRCPNH